MATRFYLTNSNTPYTPATIRGAWDQTTSAIVKYLGPAPSGVAATRAQAETSSTNNFDVLLGRWVSDGAVAAGNLSGVMSWCIGVLESSTSANDFFHIHAFVTAGDTDTVRGTLLADSIGATEWPTTATGISELDKAITTVAVSAGDRIVVEIGYQAQNTSISSFTGTMNYGNTGAFDLGATATDTNVTTRPGWVQFSDPNGLFLPVSPQQKNLCKNPASGSGDISNWAVTSNMTKAAVSLAGFNRPTGVRGSATAAAYGTITAPRAPASAGEVWSAYIEFACSVSRAGQVFLNFTDARGAFLTPNPSNNVTLGGWQSSKHENYTAPANTAFVYLTVESANIVNGDVLDVSCARYDRASSINAYADGKSPDWVWDGVADVSTSHRVPVVMVRRLGPNYRR